jgi:hypothetical protein
MKKPALFFSLILFSFSAIFATDLKYSNYDWKANPKLHELTAAEKESEELVLMEKTAFEFAYGSTGNLEEYKLYHRILRVNSNKSIEKNNRIYISSGSNIEFIKHKVRVISPGGKVKVLSDQDIKEAVDENTKMNYRFFALEGIELGSEIEYFYFMRMVPSYTGSRERLQSKIAKKNLEFEIISPLNLHFKVKSYCGLPEMKVDSNCKEKIVLALKMDYMPALIEESQSAYQSNLQQLIYKLSSNTATNLKDIASYGQVAEGVYKIYMEPAAGPVQKKVKKLIELINIKFARDDEDKIRIIDHYLKTHISILDNNSDDLENLEFVIEKKVANEKGIVKLFSAILNEIKIDYQIVLTCNREELKFDPSFEAYNFLTDYLFYFPSLNLYLLAYDPITCLGFVPQYFTYNYGLFIKKVNLDSYNTGIGKIKFIEPLTYDKNYDNLNVKVDFASGIDNPVINMERQMGGYYAQNYQPFYTYMSDEDKKKTTESIMKDFVPGLEAKDTKVENEGKDYFGIRPFIVKSTFSSDNFIEKAGEKYLFKVGELIGVQMEMYQKEERKQEVENDFNRSYHREISFEIPKGYKVSNPESLNMDVFKEEKGERVIAFTSKYSINGSSFKIIVDEYYKKISFSLEEFDSFRKVINAAADFNKITLFLEKQ